MEECESDAAELTDGATKTPFYPSKIKDPKNVKMKGVAPKGVLN